MNCFFSSPPEDEEISRNDDFQKCIAAWYGTEYVKLIHEGKEIKILAYFKTKRSVQKPDDMWKFPDEEFKTKLVPAEIKDQTPLKERKTKNIGKRVVMFSYGSGLSSFLSFKIKKSVAELYQIVLNYNIIAIEID
ncbi:hypothetical protein RCL_jg368.t1 [Rhizophagus clarus]|uniref:Uncharacterized protein n=1 Tax=Rhizophagus clarus TaxID=94130 RepID=A0A8H3LZJ1_9GLOM|nr:hypothetical protein RCL_jg368.t1 [Rhizophagus clarus]